MIHLMHRTLLFLCSDVSCVDMLSLPPDMMLHSSSLLLNAATLNRQENRVCTHIHCNARRASKLGEVGRCTGGGRVEDRVCAGGSGMLALYLSKVVNVRIVLKRECRFL